MNSCAADVYFAALELNLAVGQREDRIVFAQLGVEASEELCATLAHDDRAGLNELSTVGLHAQVLRVGIAAVPSGAGAFLMCHDNLSIKIGSSILSTHGQVSKPSS